MCPVRPGRGERPALSPCRDPACGSVRVSEEPRRVGLQIALEGEALLHRIVPLGLGWVSVVKGPVLGRVCAQCCWIRSLGQGPDFQTTFVAV